MKTLISKLGMPLAFVIAAFFAGMFVNARYFTRACPDCVIPDLSCPPPTVSIQPFEVEKIKGLRSFQYSPSYQGNIKVEGIDSVFVQRVISESVETAIKKHLKKR